MKQLFIIMALIVAGLCSCSNGSKLVILAAVKIVSDNLSVDAFLNNAKRESGVLTSDEVWANVRQAVETILSRNSDRKR